MYKEKDQKEVKEKGDGRPTRNWRMLEEKIEVKKKKSDTDIECRGGMADCSRRRECMNSRFEPHYVTEIFLLLPSGV